jgi:hypothetical protein
MFPKLPPCRIVFDDEDAGHGIGSRLSSLGFGWSPRAQGPE